MLRKPVAESDLGERLSRDRAELGQNILLACRALGFGAVLTTNHMLLQHEADPGIGRWRHDLRPDTDWLSDRYIC